MLVLSQKTERTDIRLRPGKGIVFLRSLGVPSLACSLLEFSEDGCSCSASFSTLDQVHAADWQRLLLPGTVLELDISAPPHLTGFHTQAEVRHVHEYEQKQARIGMKFSKLEAEDRGLLKKALLSLAAAKLRPEKDESACQADPSDSDAQKAASPGSSAALRDPFRGKRVGEILVMMGKLSAEEAEQAEAEAQASQERIGHYLLRRNFVTSLDLCGALALQSGLPMIDLNTVSPAPELLAHVSYLTMLKYNLIPFAGTEQTLSLASTHPLSPRVITEIEQRSGRKVEVFLAEDDLLIQRLHAMQPNDGRKHRRFTRYELSTPVSFQFCDRRSRTVHQQLYDGQTINLSEGGLAFRTGEDLQRRNGCLKICFSVPPTIVEGIYGVRSLKELAPGGELSYRVGLELLEMSAQDRSKLKQLCVHAGLALARERGAQREG